LTIEKKKIEGKLTFEELERVILIILSSLQHFGIFRDLKILMRTRRRKFLEKNEK